MYTIAWISFINSKPSKIKKKLMSLYSASFQTYQYPHLLSYRVFLNYVPTWIFWLIKGRLSLAENLIYLLSRSENNMTDLYVLEVLILSVCSPMCDSVVAHVMISQMYTMLTKIITSLTKVHSKNLFFKKLLFLKKSFLFLYNFFFFFFYIHKIKTW